MPTPLTSAFNAHHTSAPTYKGPRLRSGDLVTWRNPSTGGHHSGLRVEFIYPHLGLVLVRGDFGRVSLKHGGPSPETKRVRIDQVTVEPVAAVAAGLFTDDMRPSQPLPPVGAADASVRPADGDAAPPPADAEGPCPVCGCAFGDLHAPDCTVPDEGQVPF